MFGCITSRITLPALLLVLVSDVAGHGAVVLPRPRNAIDASLPPWSRGFDHPNPTPQPGEPGACPIANRSSQHNTRLSGALGQACFFFSSGCSIGCPTCDGVTRGPIPCSSNAHNGSCHDGCGGMRPLGHDTCQRKMNVCGLNVSATICDRALRTLNIDAPCGSETDWYYYSPWRRPGSAPTFDACGLAGGASQQAGYGVQYKQTKFAKQGDRGSRLPRTPHSFNQPEPAEGSQPWLWTAGTPAEVSWAIAANHGGGYQYRLCPLGQNLTEDCFQHTPLEFVRGSQRLRWGGRGGTELNISGTYVSEGTLPLNSTWAMNPIPSSESGTATFPPPCKESPACTGASINQPDSSCKCSGAWGPFDLEIVDLLKVPADLAPGEYVLGWRWDCEETNQVWSSCSDITVVSHSGTTRVPLTAAIKTDDDTPELLLPTPTVNAENEQTLNTGNTQGTHGTLTRSGGNDVLCADKAASNYQSSALDDIPSSPNGAVSRNAVCEYTEASLKHEFSAPGAINCYIDLPHAAGPWPPPVDPKKVDTFIAKAGTTVVQGFASSDGSSRSPLNSRAEALSGAWLVLRHLEMVGLTAVEQPNYLYYKLGGAVYVDQGRLTVEYTIFRNNYADYAGGAIAMYEPDPLGGTAIVTGCIFVNNTSFGRESGNGDNGGYGGAISHEHTQLQLLSSVFRDNKAKQGGAIFVDTNKCPKKTSDCRYSFRKLVISNCSGSGNEGGTKEALSIYDQTVSDQRRELTDVALYINSETMWAYVSLTPANAPCAFDPLPLHAYAGSCGGNEIPNTGCTPRCNQDRKQIPAVAVVASCTDEEIASVGVWKGVCAAADRQSEWFQVTWWALTCFGVAVATSLTLPFFMCRFHSKLNEVEQAENGNEDDASNWLGLLLFVHGLLDIFSDIGLCLSTTGCRQGYLFLASLISLLLPAIASLVLSFGALKAMEEGNTEAVRWHRSHYVGVTAVIVASCMRIESLSILRLRLSYLPECLGRIDFPGMTAKHYNFVRFAGGYRAVVTDIPHLLVGFAMLDLAGDGTCTDDHWWLGLLPGDPAQVARYCAIVNIIFSATSIFWGFVSRVSWSIQNRALDESPALALPQRVTAVLEWIQQQPQSEEITRRLLADASGSTQGEQLETLTGPE